MQVVKEYKEWARKIESLQKEALEIETSAKTVHKRIKQHSEQWKAEVSTRIKKVEKVFSRFFGLTKCVGKLALVCDSDQPSEWALDIQVSFRAGESAFSLSTFRQSGGERSLTIMLFMLALQRCKPAPFRVVDEINQGMDAKNERFLHSFVAELSKDSNSQFSVVTPKLPQTLHSTSRCTSTPSSVDINKDRNIKWLFTYI